jgi:ribosomal protein S21
MTTYIIDVYLLHIKSQEIDSLEVFVNKFKRKINRKVKVVTSNKNYKYYERYNETG